MKVLITGAAGQLGQSFGKLQTSIKHQLVLWDVSELDITNEASVARGLDRVRPDVVINAAAYTAVDKAEAEAELANRINHLGPLNLAKACEVRALPLLQVSTDYVFDGSASSPYSPDMAANPLGTYGLTKWNGEEAVRAHCVRHIVVRTAWVFSEFANNFMKTMLRVGAERESLNVVEDQHGAPTYAPHLAAALIKMAESAATPTFYQWGTYHFTGSPATTWHAFACEIFRQAVAAGQLSRLPVVNAILTSAYPTPAKRPAYSVLDCEQTLQVFGALERQWPVGITDALSALSKS